MTYKEYRKNRKPLGKLYKTVFLEVVNAGVRAAEEFYFFASYLFGLIFLPVLWVVSYFIWFREE